MFHKPATEMRVDPVTMEVLRGRFDAVANEMEHTLLKASFSSIVSEAQDATAAVIDSRGRTIAQACAIPIHLGALSQLGRQIHQKFPPGVAAEGDIYIVNDPYAGGTHLPDFCVAAPVFVDGNLVAYVATMTHHQDIGGAAPGSASTDVYDHHSEGLRLPLVRLATGGVVDRDLMDLMTANSRTGENMRGDLFAQIAGCRTGEKRMQSLFRDWGSELINFYIEELLSYAERLTRLAIKQIPPGEYQFSDFLDNEGLAADSDPVEIRVTVRVKGSDIEFDFTGSGKQVRAAINNVPSSTLSSVYFAIRTLTGDNAPNNDGCYRPIRCILPEGSIVNPNYPAPVNARGVAISRVMDAVMGALAKAIPARINAAGCGHATIFHVGGVDNQNRRYTGALGGPLRSGMGARARKDGVDVTDHELSNVYHVPLEVTESEFPVRYRNLSLWTDSGGAGKWRGGLGFCAAVEWLEGHAVLSIRGERHKYRPWGLEGGHSAPVCRNEMLNADQTTFPVPAKIVQPIEAGQEFRYWSTGGGGFGTPVLRDLQHVLDDVLDEKVSIQAARDIYGVIIRDNAVDVLATERQRAAISKSRQVNA